MLIDKDENRIPKRLKTYHLECGPKGNTKSFSSEIWLLIGIILTTNN